MMSQIPAPMMTYIVRLGDRDPIEVLTETSNILTPLIADNTLHDLTTPPAPGKWSVTQILGHLCDQEIVSAGRVRWMLSDDNPPLPGYDQDLWVGGLEHQSHDPAWHFDAFVSLRAYNLELFTHLSETQKQRTGCHGEAGTVWVGLIIQILAGHDLTHLDQIERTLQAVKGSSKP